MTTTLLAHGIGGVEGLPLDGELVLQTGGVVVLVSFVAVALLWTRPRFSPLPDAPPLPAALTTTLRALLLVVAIGVVGYGFAGPQDADANPAPRALFVLLWVGIVPASLLFGPVWRTVNPLRLVHRLVAAAVRPPPVELPARIGYWPGAVGLLAFAWLELIAPDRDVPAVVAGFLLGYAVVHTLAALRYGEEWFDRADAFEAYSTLTGALAPIGRDEKGRVRPRNPFRGIASVAAAPGLIAFVAVWWGSTVFDGLTGWIGWSAVRQAVGAPLLGETAGPVLVDTVVLVGAVGLVGLAYRAATGRLGTALAATLVPIAAGYTVAHYLTLLLVEGPRGLTQLAGQVLGPVTSAPSPGVVSAVQIGAVLAGHVVAVIAAHDRSIALLPENRRLADQVPLVLLMVAYTMVGLFLLVIA